MNIGALLSRSAPVFRWRHAGVPLEIFAERELLRKIQLLSDLLDTFVGLFEQELGIGGGHRCNPLGRRTAGSFPDYGGEMPGRHIREGGISAYRTLGPVILMERQNKAVGDAAVVPDGIDRSRVAPDVVADDFQHGLVTDQMHQMCQNTALVGRFGRFRLPHPLGDTVVLRDDVSDRRLRYLPARFLFHFQRYACVGYQAEDRIEIFQFADERDFREIGRRTEIVDLHQRRHHENAASNDPIALLVDSYVGIPGRAKRESAFVPELAQRLARIIHVDLGPVLLHGSPVRRLSNPLF